VLAWLEQARPRIRGRFVGVAGNLAALARGERFVEEDLNRIWSPERIAALRTGHEPSTSADAEQQRELLAEIDEIFASATGPVIFLDLHTSSARGEPFVCIGDTLRNRELAMQFPVPAILGLEENIDGALLEYVNNLGHITVGVEAGQHDHPESIDRHEAFVLLALIASGCLDERDVPHAEALRSMLSDAVGALPPVLEVRHRHPVTAEDRFSMRPGYSNFQHVSAGEVLASDLDGEIRAPESGRILLPLYQGLGDDGFFIVRRVRPFWLRVSSWLRRLGADRFIAVLPGVRRSDAAPRELVVDPRIARWFAVEVFHLLGYRKKRSHDGGLMRFARREEGTQPPSAHP
jgi:succinylglutamate desuccinylase